MSVIFFIKTTFKLDLNHILNCVNKCDFGTKCFAKVEHFVLRLITGNKKKGRPHASLHAAYSKYLILYGLIFIENPIINKSYKSTDFRIHFLSCC